MELIRQGQFVWDFIQEASKTYGQQYWKKVPVTLFFLDGPLGSGKTSFVKNFLSVFGYPQSQVQSPTFLKMNEYQVPGVGLVFHLDAYQIHEEAKLLSLGLESRILDEGVSLLFVEWPQIFKKLGETNSGLKSLYQQANIFQMNWTGLGEFTIQTEKIFQKKRVL